MQEPILPTLSRIFFAAGDRRYCNNRHTHPIWVHAIMILFNPWKASYTISASTSVDVQQWPPYSTNNRLSCVLTYPSQWFFHFGEKIIIAWTHIGWVWRLFQYLPSPAAKEIRDNVGSMSPCIVMKGDEIRSQQLSLSPECWTKMITEEIAVVGSVYCLSLRDSVVQYQSINVICHNEHRLHITLCRAHCLWTRGARMLPFIWLSLQMWFVRASPSFVQSDDPSKEVITFPLVPVQQVLWNCLPLPLLHLG